MSHAEMDAALATTEALEHELTSLQSERGLLESELIRLECSGTVAERRRRRREVMEHLS